MPRYDFDNVRGGFKQKAGLRVATRPAPFNQLDPRPICNAVSPDAAKLIGEIKNQPQFLACDLFRVPIFSGKVKQAAAQKRAAMENAFGFLPHDVVRDRTVNPAFLVYLAARVTYVKWVSRDHGPFRRLVSRGLGKNALRNAISQAKRRGFTKREQQNKGGEYGPVLEVLLLPRRREPGRPAQIVWRAWLDGSLTADEMAALLFLRAGTGKGAATYPRELEQRFEWSRPTASKVIKSLQGQGLVDTAVAGRAATGRYQGSAYRVPRLSRSALRRSEAIHQLHAFANRTRQAGVAHLAAGHVKLAGNGSAGSGNAGNIPTKVSYNALPTRPLERTNGHCSASASRQQLTCDSNDDVHDEAWASRKYLAWSVEDRLAESLVLRDVGWETINELAAKMPDAELREFLKEITHNKINRDLLSAAGLYTVRVLAVMLAEPEVDLAGEPIGVEEALVRVFRAIRMRIGDRGEWLNSYEVIGRRIAAEQYGGGRAEVFYAKNGRPRVRFPEDV